MVYILFCIHQAHALMPHLALAVFNEDSNPTKLSAEVPSVNARNVVGAILYTHTDTTRPYDHVGNIAVMFTPLLHSQEESEFTIIIV